MNNTILLCDEILKSVDNNFSLVYNRINARLLKARAQKVLGKKQAAIEECDFILNQLQKADKGLPIVNDTQNLYDELINNQ